MAYSRRFAVALAVVAAPVFAVTGASNCWIKDVTLDGGRLHVNFEAATPLAVSGTGVLIHRSATKPFAATYALDLGQTLRVEASPESPERCELEPILGPAFNGVSRNVWVLRPGTSELIVMASIVKSGPK